MTSTLIEIPGSFIARVENGRVVGYVFTPHASNAGYFGDDIIVLEGDDMTSIDFFEMIAPTLMISENSKTAMFACEWSE